MPFREDQSANANLLWVKLASRFQFTHIVYNIFTREKKFGVLGIKTDVNLF